MRVSVYAMEIDAKTLKSTVINHLAVCGCALVCACDWGSRGPGGSPGRGELLRLSRLGELLLGETSLLLQLLVEEWEEALDTTKPGERQPCRTGRVHGNRVIPAVTDDNDKYMCSLL